MIPKLRWPEFGNPFFPLGHVPPTITSVLFLDQGVCFLGEGIHTLESSAWVGCVHFEPSSRLWYATPRFFSVPLLVRSLVTFSFGRSYIYSWSSTVSWWFPWPLHEWLHNNPRCRDDHRNARKIASDFYVLVEWSVSVPGFHGNWQIHGNWQLPRLIYPPPDNVHLFQLQSEFFHQL
jgi:hypothetical protein